MDLIEELAVRYTFNGVLSRKAIDDDIVFAKNQLESLEETLKEAKLRGLNTSPFLVIKIRETKNQIAQLKELLRRADFLPEPSLVKNSGAMMTVITEGVLNGGNAVDMPKTAAYGKEPLPQNFDSAEIEKTQEHNDLFSDDYRNDDQVLQDIQTSYEVENQDEDSISVQIDVTSEEDVETPGQLEDEIENDDKKPVYPESKEIEIKDADIYKTENEVESMEDKEIREFDNSPDIKEIESGSDMERAHKESDVIAVVNDAHEKETYVQPDILCTIKEPEKDGDLADKLIQKGIVGHRTGDTQEVEHFSGPLNEVYAEQNVELVKSDNENELTDSESVVYQQGHDYEDASVVDSEKPDTQQEFPPITIDDYMEPVMNDVIVDDYYDYQVPESEFDSVYPAFPEEKMSITASIDLSEFVGFKCTHYASVTVSSEEKLINVRFSDVRDYNVFIALLLERERNRRGLFGNVLKKRKSLFMDVATASGDDERTYRYEFSSCAIKSVCDAIILRPLRLSLG